MEILGNLRLKAGRFILSKRHSPVKRIKQDFDLDRVKTVGILWDASYENDFQHLAALNKQLTREGKSVEVIAWIPGKTVPDRLTGLTYMKFLKKNDLNWFYIPASEDARQFITTRFDLVIDINPSSLFPLLSLCSLSSSPMKVGPDLTNEPENTPYDFMIRTQKPFSIALFLEQAMLYLSMISNPVSRA